MLTKKQQVLKRLFDVIFSLVGLLLLSLPIIILIIFSTISTKQFGLFKQRRIGQYGVLFTMYKIRTMRLDDNDNFITIFNDPRVTVVGNFLRRYKLDEIPQLYNVLIGDMSFVGPRPDIIGYADQLVGNDRVILSVKPGITGPATLKYRNEEELLARKPNPKIYNDTVIWKDKIRLNKDYVKYWSFLGDLKCIIHTIFH